MTQPAKDTDEKVKRAVGAWVLDSLNLILNAGALAAMLYGGLWLRNNVPSKQDFDAMQVRLNADLKELQSRVNSMDRAVLQLSETGKRIEDFEQRIRTLERSTTGRPVRPLP